MPLFRQLANVRPCPHAPEDHGRDAARRIPGIDLLGTGGRARLTPAGSPPASRPMRTSPVAGSSVASREPSMDDTTTEPGPCRSVTTPEGTSIVAIPE